MLTHFLANTNLANFLCAKLLLRTKNKSWLSALCNATLVYLERWLVGDSFLRNTFPLASQCVSNRVFLVKKIFEIVLDLLHYLSSRLVNSLTLKLICNKRVTKVAKVLCWVVVFAMIRLFFIKHNVDFPPLHFRLESFWQFLCLFPPQSKPTVNHNQCYRNNGWFWGNLHLFPC